MKFTAIDFENATAQRHTICQIGIVIFEDGNVIEKHSILVQPPNNEYGWYQTKVHGIGKQHTVFRPTFKEVWNTIQHLIEDQLLVAHNGNSFDFVALRKTLTFYEMEIPNFTTVDTYRLMGGKLNELCAIHGIPLNHHDACSDAYACGRLYLEYLSQQKFNELKKLEKVDVLVSKPELGTIAKALINVDMFSFPDLKVVEDMHCPTNINDMFKNCEILSNVEGIEKVNFDNVVGPDGCQKTCTQLNIDGLEPVEKFVQINGIEPIVNPIGNA